MLITMRNIVLIVHNVRSCHNVGSLIRTAEGFGILKIYFTGYTPYPIKTKDDRLPHLSNKIQKQINKTALGADNYIKWHQTENIFKLVDKLKQDKYTIISLEQDSNSLDITKWDPQNNIALIVGREVEGVEQEVLQVSDKIIHIPMFGKKESFNVVQAAAIALYHCRFK